jgi:hypothetical protein
MIWCEKAMATMRTKSRVLTVSLVVGILTGAMASGEPILLNPTAPHKPSTVVPLFGYRRFPQELFTFQKGKEFGFPTELIYTSAAQVPEIIKEAAQKGIKIYDMHASDMLKLIRESESDHESKHAPSSSASKAAKTIVPWTGLPQVDAEFITKLVSSELVKKDYSIFEGDLVGRNVEMVSIDRDVLRHFAIAYANLDNLKFYDPSEQINQFETVDATLAEYPALLNAAKIVFAPVSFGETFSYSAQEKGMEIPRSIRTKYDVYWVEFAVSLKDVEKGSLTEVSYNVFLPADTIALDLIPRRFGREASVVEKANTPEITIGQISLGEVYGRTIAYTTLKPTIVATGLRENQFSWILTDDAVATGSYLFVGILAVPKGRKCENAGFAVSAKAADWFGLQGDVASTGVIFKELCFG